jgi:hypothetical protein
MICYRHADAQRLPHWLILTNDVEGVLRTAANEVRGSLSFTRLQRQLTRVITRTPLRRPHVGSGQLRTCLPHWLGQLSACHKPTHAPQPNDARDCTV